MIIFENNLRQNLFKPKRTKLKHFYQFPPGACLRTPQVNLQKKLLPPPPYQILATSLYQSHPSTYKKK